MHFVAMNRRGDDYTGAFKTMALQSEGPFGFLGGEIIELIGRVFCNEIYNFQQTNRNGEI